MLLVSTTRIIPGRAVPSFLSGRYSAFKVRKKKYVTTPNDVVGDAVRSADEDTLEQLYALLGPGGHIVSARALLRAFFSRSLFGFPRWRLSYAPAQA